MILAEACNALLDISLVTMNRTRCLKVFGVYIVNLVDFILFGGEQKSFMSQGSIYDDRTMLRISRVGDLLLT